jgi:hypothetical protein
MAAWQQGLLPTKADSSGSIYHCVFDLAVSIMALMLFLSMICVCVDQTLLQDAIKAPADLCSR